jgi:hypothetical protein
MLDIEVVLVVIFVREDEVVEVGWEILLPFPLLVAIGIPRSNRSYLDEYDE